VDIILKIKTSTEVIRSAALSTVSTRMGLFFSRLYELNGSSVCVLTVWVETKHRV